MKIQSLAIIFIIIILPISLLLSSYTKSRVETISLQATYDSKLNDATYDALAAYQINSLNSDTSDYTNSKIRDIKASVNTFFTTMSTSFSSLGYTKSTLQNYVPALVYTMYDGYYIYAPFTNTWDTETNTKHGNDESYNADEDIYGLKPYVYYSCRYKDGEKYDVTITYSLENYIQIQGYVTEGGKKETVSKYGYLLNDITVNGDSVFYKGIEIKEESMQESVFVDGAIKTLPCIKKNGTKYYVENGKVFSVLNGKSVIQQSGITVDEVVKNSNAKQYYKEAAELKNFIDTSYLKDIKVNNIVATSDTEKNNYTDVGKIFDGDIESETSNFNIHRMEVIKNSIEKNLAIVINNFNSYSGASTDFQMPKLKETDWDKIMNNISIISFLQGVNIGGKVYNGYSIITNTQNEDIVMPDSIYIQTTDNVYHRITEDGLKNLDLKVGVYNINTERRSQEYDGQTHYFFPVSGTLSYDSIITQNGISPNYNGDLSEYLKSDNVNSKLRELYYTALGRERYGIYRQKLEINPGDN